MMSTPTPPPPPPVEPPPMQPPMSPPPGPNRADMLSKVKGPALAMMIIAGITFVLEILSTLAGLLGISFMGAGDMS
ncbi:MAG: hypothetical protein ABFS37_12060, partial [Acidobacteriota bacterium]